MLPRRAAAIVGDSPLLMLGGNRDGVIEASTIRYGLDGASSTFALEKTLSESVSGESADRFLVILAGANHFSVVSPIDETTGRPFLDHPPEGDEAEMRSEITQLIKLFINGTIQNQADARQAFIEQINPDRPIIALSQHK